MRTISAQFLGGSAIKSNVACTSNLMRTNAMRGRDREIESSQNTLLVWLAEVLGHIPSTVQNRGVFVAEVKLLDRDGAVSRIEI